LTVALGYLPSEKFIDNQFPANDAKEKKDKRIEIIKFFNKTSTSSHTYFNTALEFF